MFDDFYLIYNVHVVNDWLFWDIDILHNVTLSSWNYVYVCGYYDTYLMQFLLR